MEKLHVMNWGRSTLKHGDVAHAMSLEAENTLQNGGQGGS